MYMKNFVDALFAACWSFVLCAVPIPAVIIGSGPAGHAAALAIARAKIGVAVVRGNEPGGQLMGSSLVENMPGVPAQEGYKIMEEMEQRNRDLGVSFIDGIVTSVQPQDGNFSLMLDNGLELEACSVIIATGATARTLQVPGEELYLNKSVFTCAVCDCRQATDKEVIVVGGGDSAIEAILHLVPYARHITLVVRKNYLRAVAIMQERLKEQDKVSMLYDHELVEMQGDGLQLQEVVLRNARTGLLSRQAVDCVFLAIGHKPHSAPFRSLVACDADGYIVAMGRTQKTSMPGIFVAGDVEDRVYRQAYTATGDAGKAAFEVIAYLREQGKAYGN